MKNQLRTHILGVFNTPLLIILLTAVCANAEWTYDNDKQVQEREDKRDEEREEARKALDRVRFGVKVGGGCGGGIDNGNIGGGNFMDGAEAGIMINIPFSRLNSGNLVLTTELNFGFRKRAYKMDQFSYVDESYLSIPLMLQYVSFFYPTSDIQVHWVPSPKRYFFMHFKTIAEAGAFIDIPLGTTIMDDEYSSREDYKGRNFFDLGVMVGGAVQLESIILGIRGAASYTDLGDSGLLLQFKGYLGYLF